MFIFSKDASNVRNIHITETVSGAIVGVVLSGMQDVQASVESLSFRVHIEYQKDRQNDIELIMQLALRQAMKALQHELMVSQTKTDAKR
jgi:hypothetical protein